MNYDYFLSLITTYFIIAVPKDIDDEANSYFQRIYNHPPHPTLSIDEVLDMLKKFMDSPKQRERVCLSKI